MTTPRLFTLVLALVITSATAEDLAQSWTCHEKLGEGRDLVQLSNTGETIFPRDWMEEYKDDDNENIQILNAWRRGSVTVGGKEFFALYMNLGHQQTWQYESVGSNDLDMLFELTVTGLGTLRQCDLKTTFCKAVMLPLECELIE